MRLTKSDLVRAKRASKAVDGATDYETLVWAIGELENIIETASARV
jgi:hypothetical protein